MKGNAKATKVRLVYVIQISVSVCDTVIIVDTLRKHASLINQTGLLSVPGLKSAEYGKLFRG